MAGIDETRQFVPLKIAVLTVSDTRERADDKSGALLAERIRAAGHKLAERAIVKDEVKTIRQHVKAWIADKFIDVVITTGGTGFTGRDVTPEAVEPLFEKKMDAFGAMFLLVSERKIGTSAIQTRATGSWTSPVTGGVYPSGWQVGVATQGLALTLTPELLDQELVTAHSTGIAYWEGAVRIGGTRDGRPLTGQGYVELTGYAAIPAGEQGGAPFP